MRSRLQEAKKAFSPRQTKITMQILTKNAELVSSSSPSGGSKKKLSMTMQLLRQQLTGSRSSSPSSSSSKKKSGGLSSSRSSSSLKPMSQCTSTAEGLYSQRRKHSAMPRNKSFDAATSMKLKNGRSAIALAKSYTAASRRQMVHEAQSPRIIGSKPSAKYAGDGAFRR